MKDWQVQPDLSERELIEAKEQFANSDAGDYTRCEKCALSYEQGYVDGFQYGRGPTENDPKRRTDHLFVAVGDHVFPAGPARDQQFVRPFLVNAIADKVLAYKPKPKSKPARKRARLAKKLQAADV